jgi:hypothetical protein
MDDNYTVNHSNNANVFKIDRYFLDTCSACWITERGGESVIEKYMLIKVGCH